MKPISEMNMTPKRKTTPNHMTRISDSSRFLFHNNELSVFKTLLNLLEAERGQIKLWNTLSKISKYLMMIECILEVKCKSAAPVKFFYPFQRKGGMCTPTNADAVWIS